MSCKLVVIVGETASGKSDLAMQIARKHNGEIIAADSRTIYKGFDIGTAKPSQADQAEISHHLLDLVEPGEDFSAGKFKKLANQAIADICSRGKLPILVGGTGLYVDSVIFDFEFAGEVDEKERERLSNLNIDELRDEVERVQEVVEQLFMDGAPREEWQNPRHMIRYIETGGTPSGNDQLRQDTLLLGIKREREGLIERIEARVEQMFAAGLEEEVRKLVDQYSWDKIAQGGIVYLLFKELHDGEITDIEELKQKFVTKDLQYAKRQRTWFKRNPHIVWSKNFDDLQSKVRDFA